MTPTDKEKTFRIGEAAELLGLETYVLRFWETEFPHLAPLRTPKGQRLYAERHIEKLRQVKHLLHEQGFTIEGARRVLEGEAAGEERLGGESAAGPCQGFLFSPPPARAVVQGEALSAPVDDGKAEAGPVAAMPGEELNTPRLREALRALQRELVEVRDLLRAHSAQGPSGDDA